MKLVYDVKDKPKFGQLIVFALQQLLAILSATILVPYLVGHKMSQPAALFGAGVGTIVYLLFTKFKSPVFLGSSFAFIGSMTAAFAGGVSASLGYAGMILGAILAGFVYVVIALIVKFAGTKWIDKLMPAVVIGPTVAIIGLSLSGTAIQQALDFPVWDANASAYVSTQHMWISLICALVTLFAVVISSVYGKKTMKLIPFIIGILAGYACAAIFTVIGEQTGNDALKLIDFSAFKVFAHANEYFKVPDFTFLTAAKGVSKINSSYFTTIAVAYIPVAFVVFAEHIADHKNLSSVIDKDLLEEPGLHRTLLGDGVGSMVGAFFGGCPNTTYGESVGCVAITGNASVITIFTTAIMAIAISFLDPFVTFLSTIPNCVMGGVCITLYGFIAVSGLKMLQPVDLNDNGNLFTASSILIAGVGSMAIKIVLKNGNIVLTEIAVALILGIVTNLIVSKKKAKASK
ncbi:MAG: uracil-xanthine permease [Clostridia bacterium]|nr:uracil-xanthine permease [Clostridia bacterium]